MHGRPFLVAQFPGLASLAGGYTRANPGSSTDTILEHALDGGPSTDIQSLGFLRGWRREDENDFVARLRHGGAQVTVVQRMPDSCLVRFASRVPRAPDSAAGLLREAGASVGGPWMHVESGMHSIRGEFRDAGQAATAVARLRQAWSGRGVSYDVGLRHVAPREHRAWVDLPASLREASRLIQPFGALRAA